MPFRSRSPIEMAEQFALELESDVVRVINCDDCVMFGTGACDDCVVSFLLGLDERAPAIAPRLEMSHNELDTLSMLQSSGLAPESQYAARPVSLAFARRR